MGNKIIIGAGIAGFGKYYADNSAEIYEASNRAGGMCRGFWIKNFYFDQGSHLSFTKNEIVRQVFSQTEQYIHHPFPKSWYKEIWVKHPAQNNLFPLSVEYKISSIKSFIERHGRENADNFKEWLVGGYGEFLYENLFKIYNEKYWKTSPENMGVNWVANRFYLPEIDEVLYGAFCSETPNVFYAPESHYPKQGGFYSFFSHIADKAESNSKIHYGKKMSHINIQNKIVYFFDNTEVKYDELYSSAPLPEMIKMIDDVPDNIRKMAERLEYTKTSIVSIGLNCNDFKQLWFYIYDSDILAARAYMPSVKSPNNAPEGCSSIQFEIYSSSKDKMPTPEKCIENSIYALEKLGIAKKENILFTDYRIIPYANVTMLKTTEEEVPLIREWLANQGVTPIGRFGQWDYLWTDQAFLSGYLS